LVRFEQVQPGGFEGFTGQMLADFLHRTEQKRPGFSKKPGLSFIQPAVGPRRD